MISTVGLSHALSHWDVKCFFFYTGPLAGSRKFAVTHRNVSTPYDRALCRLTPLTIIKSDINTYRTSITIIDHPIYPNFLVHRSPQNSEIPPFHPCSHAGSHSISPSQRRWSLHLTTRTNTSYFNSNSTVLRATSAVKDRSNGNFTHTTVLDLPPRLPAVDKR